MKPGGAVPLSQGLSNNPYPEPNQPNSSYCYFFLMNANVRNWPTIIDLPIFYSAKWVLYNKSNIYFFSWNKIVRKYESKTFVRFYLALRAIESSNRLQTSFSFVSRSNVKDNPASLKVICGQHAEFSVVRFLVRYTFTNL